MSRSDCVCIAGFRKTASQSFSLCAKCDAGTYSNTIQSTDCTACAAGSFQNDTGATACADCPANSYAALGSRASCSPCPSGATSPAGSDDKLDCVCFAGGTLAGPGALTTLAGTSNGWQDGTADVAKFNRPFGLALIPGLEDKLVIADTNNNMIRIIHDGSTTTVSTLAGSTTLGSQDGVGSNAGFNRPSDVKVTPDGLFVVVAEANNHMIRLVRLVDSSDQLKVAGTVSTLAGSTTAGLQDGVGTNAGFAGYLGIAITPDGATVVVADGGNHLVMFV